MRRTDSRLLVWRIFLVSFEFSPIFCLPRVERTRGLSFLLLLHLISWLVKFSPLQEKNRILVLLYFSQVEQSPEFELRINICVSDECTAWHTYIINLSCHVIKD